MKPSFNPDYQTNLERIAAAGSRVLNVSLRSDPEYAPHGLPEIPCVGGYTQLSYDDLLGLPWEERLRDGREKEHPSYLAWKADEGDNPLFYLAWAAGRIGGAAHIAELIDGPGSIWMGLTAGDIRGILHNGDVALRMLESMAGKALEDADSVNSILEAERAAPAAEN